MSSRTRQQEARPTPRHRACTRARPLPRGVGSSLWVWAAPSERDTLKRDRQVTIDLSPQVLVVGAGPTGLLLASELVRRAVSCLLIDALDAPRGWDRATVVHERSLEIFEALGVAERFLTEGVRTRGARIHSDGQVLAVLDLDLTGSRYGSGRHLRGGHRVGPDRL